MQKRLLLPVLMLSVSIAGANEMILQCDFNQWGHSWLIPSYYQGRCQFYKSGGRSGGMLKITPTRDKKGKLSARAVNFPKTSILAGRKIRLSGWVRGRGIFTAGFAGGKDSQMKLDGTWKAFSCTLDCTVTFPAAAVPRLGLTGDGEAVVDDVRLEFITVPGIAVSATPRKLTVPRGTLPEITFSTGKPGVLLTLYFLDQKKKLISKEKIQTGSKGTSSFIPGGKLLPGKYYATAAAGGVNTTSEITILP